MLTHSVKYQFNCELLQCLLTIVYIIIEIIIEIEGGKKTVQQS